MNQLLLRIMANAPPGIPNITNPFPQTPATHSAVQTILQVVFGIAGSIAFLIIMLSGFRLVTSNGDPQALAKARNTIIYALVGLVVAISAFTIVSFALNRL